MIESRFPVGYRAGQGPSSKAAVMLTPSCGLGGGIERYSNTLEWALGFDGVKCVRLDLQHAGALAHAGMVSRALEAVRAQESPPRLILSHRSLLPLAFLVAGATHVSGMTVICHGADVWGNRPQPRRGLENRLMRRDDVRVVAASTFTAGALAEICRAAILPPGLSQDWFGKLVTASTVSRTTDTRFQLVTAFRLADWRDKGLPEVLTALRLLGRSDVRLTVCGTGNASLELEQLIGSYEFCSLRTGLNDVELAGVLATADLFVLATRTRPGRNPCGEGFGLVLLEAQVAGTPVVAPASGGSRDAFIEGVTGSAPIDESQHALAEVLDQLLREPHRLTNMGVRAAAWSREIFAPESYAKRAVAAVL